MSHLVCEAESPQITQDHIGLTHLEIPDDWDD